VPQLRQAPLSKLVDVVDKTNHVEVSVLSLHLLQIVRADRIKSRVKEFIVSDQKCPQTCTREAVGLTHGTIAADLSAIGEPIVEIGYGIGKHQ
jgi:hypothetical protein